MTLDLPALESWLWEAGGIIRVLVEPLKFKSHLLPLISLKPQRCGPDRLPQSD